MLFSIVAILLALIFAFLVIRPLAIRRRAALPRAAHDAQVFRDQLAEVDRDLERGVLDDDQARAARIEISRRLLAADAEARAHAAHQPAPQLASAALAILVLIGAPLGSYWLYNAIGAPGMPDQPIAAREQGARPGQALAEARLGRPAPTPPPEAAEAVALVAQLEERLAGADPDPQGLFLLARSYGQLGRYTDAWQTYQRLVARLEGDAPAMVFTAKAEAMIIAAAGYVSPEAEAALGEALRRDPADPVARFYMGTTQAQLDRPRAALDIWAGVLRDSPADAPWVPATFARIEALVEMTGLPMPDITPRAQPDTAEQRRMMAALVTSFEERLMVEGGTVDEWAQLVRSWEALGAEADATRARNTALSAIGDNTEARAAFEAALAERETPATPHDAEDLRATVAALDARLAAEGGTAGAWLRLISSWRGLGEEAAAQAATERARAALAGDAAQLAALEGGLGTRPTEGLRGPSPDDVAAAAGMEPADRDMMVRVMVETLQDRLFHNGGSAEEWGRLIQSLGVLGDTEAATEAWERAAADHASDRIALAFLRETALLAGVTPQ